MPDNPFVQVYDALWSLAEASSELTSKVRVGNRVKFNHTGYDSPIKDEVSDADLPELVLVSTGSGGNLLQTSSTSMITRQYEWLLATGDMSVVNRLLPVEWALYAAMADWPSVLGALRWPSDDTVEGFVKRAQLLSVNSGLTDSERNRGIVGWSSSWAIEVEMHFRTSDLRAVGA